MLKPKKLVALPCPCCGNTDLYIGHESFDTIAVRCWAHAGGCGLRMVVDAFMGLKANKKGLKVLDHYATRMAVKAWNRRVK